MKEKRSRHQKGLVEEDAQMLKELFENALRKEEQEKEQIRRSIEKLLGEKVHKKNVFGSGTGYYLVEKVVKGYRVHINLIGESSIKIVIRCNECGEKLAQVITEKTAFKEYLATVIEEAVRCKSQEHICAITY